MCNFSLVRYANKMQKTQNLLTDCRLPIPLPELRRRHPLLTLEELPESRLVREAELVGNLLVGHLGSQQGVLDLAD